MSDLGVLGCGGLISRCNSTATGINPSGQVVGWSETEGGQHAFIWESGVITDLGTAGGSFSHAYAINPSGQVVGVSSPAGDLHATLWTRK